MSNFFGILVIAFVLMYVGLLIGANAERHFGFVKCAEGSYKGADVRYCGQRLYVTPVHPPAPLPTPELPEVKPR